MAGKRQRHGNDESDVGTKIPRINSKTPTGPSSHRERTWNETRHGRHEHNFENSRFFASSRYRPERSSSPPNGSYHDSYRRHSRSPRRRSPRRRTPPGRTSPHRRQSPSSPPSQNTPLSGQSRPQDSDRAQNSPPRRRNPSSPSQSDSSLARSRTQDLERGQSRDSITPRTLAAANLESVPPSDKAGATSSQMLLSPEPTSSTANSVVSEAKELLEAQSFDQLDLFLEALKTEMESKMFLTHETKSLTLWKEDMRNSKKQYSNYPYLADQQKQRLEALEYKVKLREAEVSQHTSSRKNSQRKILQLFHQGSVSADRNASGHSSEPNHISWAEFIDEMRKRDDNLEAVRHKLQSADEAHEEQLQNAQEFMLKSEKQISDLKARINNLEMENEQMSSILQGQVPKAIGEIESLEENVELLLKGKENFQVKWGQHEYLINDLDSRCTTNKSDLVDQDLKLSNFVKKWSEQSADQLRSAQQIEKFHSEMRDIQCKIEALDKKIPSERMNQVLALDHSSGVQIEPKEDQERRYERVLANLESIGITSGDSQTSVTHAPQNGTRLTADASTNISTEAAEMVLSRVDDHRDASSETQSPDLIKLETAMRSFFQLLEREINLLQYEGMRQYDTLRKRPGSTIGTGDTNTSPTGHYEPSNDMQPIIAKDEATTQRSEKMAISESEQRDGRKTVLKRKINEIVHCFLRCCTPWTSIQKLDSLVSVRITQELTHIKNMLTENSEIYNSVTGPIEKSLAENQKDVNYVKRILLAEVELLKIAYEEYNKRQDKIEEHMNALCQGAHRLNSNIEMIMNALRVHATELQKHELNFRSIGACSKLSQPMIPTKEHQPRDSGLEKDQHLQRSVPPTQPLMNQDHATYHSVVGQGYPDQPYAHQNLSQIGPDHSTQNKSSYPMNSRFLSQSPKHANLLQAHENEAASYYLQSSTNVPSAIQSNHFPPSPVSSSGLTQPAINSSYPASQPSSLGYALSQTPTQLNQTPNPRFQTPLSPHQLPDPSAQTQMLQPQMSVSTASSDNPGPLNQSPINSNQPTSQRRASILINELNYLYSLQNQSTMGCYPSPMLAQQPSPLNIPLNRLPTTSCPSSAQSNKTIMPSISVYQAKTSNVPSPTYSNQLNQLSTAPNQLPTNSHPSPGPSNQINPTLPLNQIPTSSNSSPTNSSQSAAYTVAAGVYPTQLPENLDHSQAHVSQASSVPRSSYQMSAPPTQATPPFPNGSPAEPFDMAPAPRSGTDQNQPPHNRAPRQAHLNQAPVHAIAKHTGRGQSLARRGLQRKMASGRVDTA